MFSFSLQTDSRVCFKDITNEINRCIEKAGVESGLCCVFVPHTTAAVTVNERADPNVVGDVSTSLNKLIPFDDDYKHLEGNSAAHIKSSIIGASELIPVANRRLVLGVWQAVFFCEFDGPRQRRIIVKVMRDMA